jgi:hypothetical protein
MGILVVLVPKETIPPIYMAAVIGSSGTAQANERSLQ